VKQNIRQQRKNETRQIILETSKRLFTEFGYEDTSTRQIAADAGVGIGTVFAHFPDKHQLLREILFQDIENVLGKASADLPAQAGAVDALLHYAHALYSYYRSQWTLSRVLLKGIMFDASYYQVQMDGFVEELSGRLVSECPQMTEFDRAVLAQCLVSSYLMVLIRGLGTPDSTLEDWMYQLAQSCRVQVRPLQGAA
jgi:AcrR family transcriptional regulator